MTSHGARGVVGLGRQPAAPVGPVKSFRFSPVAIGAGGNITGLSFSGDGVLRMSRADGLASRWDPTAGYDGRGRHLRTTDAYGLPAGELAGINGTGTLAVAVAWSDHHRGYMAFGDSVYTWDDTAKKWTRTNLSGVQTGPNDDWKKMGSRLEVDPINPNVVAYGTQLLGLKLTADGGANWTQVSTDPSTGVPLGTIWQLDDPSAPETLTHTTYNDGTHQYSSGGVQAVAWDYTGPTSAGRTKVLYAFSLGNGLYRTNDATASTPAFTKVSTGQPFTQVRYMRVLSDGSVLLTGTSVTSDQGSQTRVYRYVPDGSTGLAGTWSVSDPDSAKGRAYGSFHEDPSTPGRISLVGGPNWYGQSQDYGITWVGTSTKALASADDIPWLAAATTGNFTPCEVKYDPVVAHRVWLSEGTGIWYADLGSAPWVSGATITWNSQARGIEQIVSNFVRCGAGDTVYGGGLDRKVFTWHGDTSYLFPSKYLPDAVFAAAWGGSVSPFDRNYACFSICDAHTPTDDPHQSFFTTDGGVTTNKFLSVPLNSTHGVSTFGYGDVVCSTPGNIVWFPAYSARPYVTIDGTATWQLVNIDGFTDANYNKVNNKAYYVLHWPAAADEVNPDTFYLYVATFGYYKSTDKGQNFYHVADSGTMGADFSYNCSMKGALGKAGHLFFSAGRFSTPGGPLKFSQDGAATWTNVAGFDGVNGHATGAPAPGATYPAVYVSGYRSGVEGIWRSIDFNPTTATGTWTNLGLYPNGYLQNVDDLDADKVTYGRFYACVIGYVKGEYAYGTSSTSSAPTPDADGLYAVSGSPDSDGLYPIPGGSTADSDGLYPIGA